MSFLCLFVLLVNAAAAAAAAAGTVASGDVVVLTRSNITSSLRDGQNWFVMFAAPWCGHCKRLKPVWAEAAKELAGHTVLASVDGDSQLDLAARFGVTGYPTLVHVRAGSAVRVFAGERSKTALVAYARGGYAADAPLSFWQSPLSLFGDAIGLVTLTGYYITQARDWLLNSGYPFPLVVLMGIGALLAVSIVLSLLTVWCMSLTEGKRKRD